MTQEQLKQIKKLLNLADAAADFEHVDINLVMHFHVMREELGLAHLLLMIQEYVTNKVQSGSDTKVSQTSQQSQNSVQ